MRAVSRRETMGGMKRFAGLFLTLALPLLALACRGDDSKSAVIGSSPAATPSTNTLAPTLTLAPASTVVPRTTPTPSSSPLTTPPATGTTAPAGAQVWDAQAVWDVSKAPDALWKQVCNVSSPVMLRGDEACIVQVMQQANAPQQAIDFYKQNGYFVRIFM